MISIEKIKFGYTKNHLIFDEFSMNINPGILGLVGVNGAGKSTLLKLILGLLRLQDGDIKINSLSIRNDRFKILKSVGVVFEDAEFPAWTKVYDQLIYVGILRGLSRERCLQEVNQLLEEFDIVEKKASFVNSLSAGLKQRFSIIQACIGYPKLLLLDEPSSNLDAHARIKTLEFLRRISKNKGVNIIILSHVLSDLEKFCDEFAIMHNGKIVVSQSINELITNNFHKYFSLSIPDNRNIDPVVELIQDLCVITHQTEFQIQLKIETKKQYQALYKIKLPEFTTLIPQYSLLEQYFLEKTEKLK